MKTATESHPKNLAVRALTILVIIQAIALFLVTRALLNSKPRTITDVVVVKQQPAPQGFHGIDQHRPQENQEAARASILKGIQAQAAFPKESTEMPGLMDLLNDPELSPVFAHQIKNQFLGPYTDLFQSLNLDVSTSEAFRSLLAERLVSTYEVVNLSRDGTAGSVAESLEQNKRKIDGEIRTLIGNDAYSAFAEYESTLALRNSIKQVTRPLGFSNEPLSANQMNDLIAAMSRASPQAASQTAVYTNPSVRTNVTLGQIQAQASAASLTPNQLKLITDEFEMQAKSRQLETQHSARFQRYLKSWAEQTGRPK